MEDVLSFKILEQEYAISIENIESVVDMTDITQVPNAKYFIEGLINLRGRIVPIIDLAKILDLKLPEEHKYENILVLKINEEEIGMLVDEVENVLTIDPSKLEKIQSKKDVYSENVKGIIKIDNRLIVYIDLIGILEKELHKDLK
ncbi:MAG: chemotaxis protein CheW [Defluviitoga tunisiensis]|mgnify:CR=1 FL=1|jgi:purine-binding chemotaxis protein CheW|nr:chemotaxis protein CheW [Defluviitoga tunisiensis]MDY0379515.1 chemotaxis protein CheW [Defluviitoga tunisiensis]HOB55566.1 chemotaxis protein CheW [Defluviitoga tunisiensis]HOK16049.1 chemotaxis protein CheW [Defluviitoga tunisiensis]HOL86198.1 chemotaxis protein CheW [Defluviitoga tunisiensis]